MSFYAGFLYKLVTGSVTQNEGESEEDFKHRLNFCEGLVFITLGLSQLFTGLLYNSFGKLFSNFKLAIVATLIVEFASFASLLCYFNKSFPLCFVCAFFWGSAENFLQSNTSALISKLFPEQVEAFSVYRIFFAIGVVSVLILNVALSEFESYIFLSIVVIMQIIITGISINLQDL